MTLTPRHKSAQPRVTDDDKEKGAPADPSAADLGNPVPDKPDHEVSLTPDNTSDTESCDASKGSKHPSSDPDAGSASRPKKKMCGRSCGRATSRRRTVDKSDL